MINSIKDVIQDDIYIGRGLLTGKSSDDKCLILAYFIMGRSANSQNRVFVKENDFLKILPADDDKVEDPSLIIYYPMKKVDDKYIVTNGDQTDTIYTYLKEGKTYEEALFTRNYEPDAPNFTPRISVIADLSRGSEDFQYGISILKYQERSKEKCNRNFFYYTAQRGTAHMIHTYEGDGNPLPSYCGEPKTISVGNSVDELAKDLWNSLHKDYKVALYTAFINLEDNSVEERIINKYERK